MRSVSFDDAFGALVQHISDEASKPRLSNPYSPSRAVSFDIEGARKDLLIRLGITDERNFNSVRPADSTPAEEAIYDAAWELSRLGILRHVGDDRTRKRFWLTARGEAWLRDRATIGYIPRSGSRFALLIRSMTPLLGAGFEQRAGEAHACYMAGQFLASCVMSGAAAESILLAVAIAKSGSEADVLKLYGGARGRSEVRKLVVGPSPTGVFKSFYAATSLIDPWRDEAAHGRASSIDETEAHESLLQLLHFAKLAEKHWSALTK